MFDVFAIPIYEPLVPPSDFWACGPWLAKPSRVTTGQTAPWLVKTSQVVLVIPWSYKTDRHTANLSSSALGTGICQMNPWHQEEQHIWASMYGLSKAVCRLVYVGTWWMNVCGMSIFCYCQCFVVQLHWWKSVTISCILLHQSFVPSLFLPAYSSKLQ